jgi:hypothetical protein
MAGRAVRSWQDKRAFAVFDVGYLDNPKIAHIFDASPIAVCMHFASVLYCAQHLTDGEVAAQAMQRKVGGTKEDTQLLLDEGLWHRPGHGCEQCPEVSKGKVYVHDYTKHNRTSDGVKRASAVGRKGAEARWGDDADGNANRMPTASEPHSQPQSEPQCENVPTAMARQTDRQTLKDSSKSDEEFDRWYAGYPRKEAKANARKAFAKARRTAGMDILMASLERYVASVKGKERQYIALPATWLNAGRWEDEYAPASKESLVHPAYAWANQ